MNSRLLLNKALTMCLTIAIITTYSLVVLAANDKIVGELVVSGKITNGQNLFVKINGEAAQSGRSVFSGTTIATPENTTAVINLGKAGKIELAPNTTLSLSFTEKDITGDLSAGRVTVLSASRSVTVKTPQGNVAELNTGESATAANEKSQTDVGGGNGSNLLLYAIILGGAAAGIILAATSDNNRIALGGGSTIVSSTR